MKEIQRQGVYLRNKKTSAPSFPNFCSAEQSSAGSRKQKHGDDCAEVRGESNVNHYFYNFAVVYMIFIQNTLR